MLRTVNEYAEELREGALDSRICLVLREQLVEEKIPYEVYLRLPQAVLGLDDVRLVVFLDAEFLERRRVSVMISGRYGIATRLENACKETVVPRA